MSRRGDDSEASEASAAPQEDRKRCYTDTRMTSYFEKVPKAGRPSKKKKGAALGAGRPRKQSEKAACAPENQRASGETAAEVSAAATLHINALRMMLTVLLFSQTWQRKRKTYAEGTADGDLLRICVQEWFNTPVGERVSRKAYLRLWEERGLPSGTVRDYIREDPTKRKTLENRKDRGRQGALPQETAAITVSTLING